MPCNYRGQPGGRGRGVCSSRNERILTLLPIDRAACHLCGECRLMKWVTIKKAAELSCYSEKEIEAKRADGTWFEGVVWIKAPDGRILISPDGIDQWAEGRVLAAQAPRRGAARP